MDSSQSRLIPMISKKPNSTMIANPFSRHAICLAVIAGLGLSNSFGQTTLYEQSFTPGAETTGLNGTSPTIGANNWVASPLFQGDGDIMEGTAGGSATLAFTPVDGFIYTLDASFRNLGPTANVGSPEQDWVAVGFAKGQSAITGANNRFINANVIGKAWMLYRGANTVGTLDNVTHLGSATSGINAGAMPSTSLNWSALSTNYGGDIDMRVVLDTTGGTGNWTATWFAKLPASGTYTEVRAATTLLNEDINSVGVAISNPGIEGDLTRFSLTATSTALPNITDIEIDGNGDVILMLDGPVAGLTVQRSGTLEGFSDVASTADTEANTLTIDASDVDPDADGKDFFRVRN
jgi:hypothetical protein